VRRPISEIVADYERRCVEEGAVARANSGNATAEDYMLMCLTVIVGGNPPGLCDR